MVRRIQLILTTPNLLHYCPICLPVMQSCLEIPNAIPIIAIVRSDLPNLLYLQIEIQVGHVHGIIQWPLYIRLSSRSLVRVASVCKVTPVLDHLISQHLLLRGEVVSA